MLFVDKNEIKSDKNGYFRTGTGKTKESLKEKIDYISENFAKKDVKDSVKIFNGNSVFTDNLNKIAHSRFIFSSKDKVKGFWKDSKTFWQFMVSKIIDKDKK
jgi:hypothetical protein